MLISYASLGYFSVYQVFDGGKVMIGNNALYWVISERNVKIHYSSIYELKQVRHVPDLKKNLISLRMIDQVRCIVKVQHVH